MNNEAFCTFIDSNETEPSYAILPIKKRKRKNGYNEFQAPKVKNYTELDNEISLFYCRNKSCEQERGTV